MTEAHDVLKAHRRELQQFRRDIQRILSQIDWMERHLELITEPRGTV